MLKSSADIHRYFVNSKRLEYLFSSPMSHFRVSTGVFLNIFWINLGLWTLFSSSYILFLWMFDVPIGYPWLYLKFTIGTVLSIVIGTEIAMHYFSSRRYLMLFPVLLISALWYYHDLLDVLLILSIATPYLLWVLKKAYHSFGFVRRKRRGDRMEDSMNARNGVEAMLWKDITLLWRERLIASFVFSSVTIGIGSGYIATHMDVNLIPLKVRNLIVPSLPFIFLFLGTFIVSSYLFIFPMLNAFLAEEDTLWLLKHLPISGKDTVKGKVMSMCLPLLTSLPFPFFFMLFSGAGYLYIGFSLLFLSFFVSTAISLPFGIKYAGRKSDVMLLYTISVLLFSLLTAGAYVLRKLTHLGIAGFLMLIGALLISGLLLLISMEFSGRMMERKCV
jgi:hypothetical protein